jgi:peptidoglycan hydrolase CwlO-like protein
MPSNTTLSEKLKQLTMVIDELEGRAESIDQRTQELMDKCRELQSENKRLEGMVTALTKELLLTRKQARK